MKYKVRLTNKAKGLDTTIEVSDDEYILGAAAEQGIDLPGTCMSGACSACAAKLISGTVDQGDQSYLDKDQIDAGFVILCVAFPTSDSTLKTHCEDEVV